MPNMICSKNKGFSLIEVLVAALVLAIGILGLATAMLTGLKSDKSAYYRSQASAIAYDMADRMRLNRDEVDNYSAFDTSDATPADSACVTDITGCTPAQIVNVDFREWKLNFDNVTNVARFSPKLPNGRGQITQDNNGRYIITVSWSEDDWEDNANVIARADTTQSLSVTLEL